MKQLIEEKIKEVMDENWHAVEGPNGQCACGDKGVCGKRLKTALQGISTLSAEQERKEAEEDLSTVYLLGLKEGKEQERKRILEVVTEFTDDLCPGAQEFKDYLLEKLTTNTKEDKQITS